MNDSEVGSGIIIELFGAPGIGKSYLAKGLSARFRANGMNVSDRSVSVGEMSRIHRVAYKVRIIFPMLVLKPGIFMALLLFTSGAGVKKPKSLIQVLVNWLYIIALIRQEIKGNGIVILDQGIAQALWSTVFRGNISDNLISPELFTSILHACNAQQLVVVHLSLDSKIHQERLASRSNGCSPLDNGDPDKFERGLHTARSVGRAIELLSNRIGFSRLCKIDFENDINNADVLLHKKLLDFVYSTY